MVIDWHSRFLQQATWTRELREYLFLQADMDSAKCVLEIGCGTGALLEEMTTRKMVVHGLDRETARLAEARIHAPKARYLCGDALSLPYPSSTFDICYCHYLLLWVKKPLQVLFEMKRVTRSGGHVIALAEPDYEHRVDKPASLSPLGCWQVKSLHRQGADPSLGGRLAELFVKAGIQINETGTLNQQGERSHTPRERELEWAVLEADLKGLVPASEIQRLKQIDEQAWLRGNRVLYVPTYFASGVV